MAAITPLLGLAAGSLSILSPCVLPLVPIVLASAASKHRAGALALGGGLALSFTLIGLFVALVGFSIGIDGDVFRRVGGGVMAIVGATLLVPRLQSALASATGPVSAWANARSSTLEEGGLTGQFGLGLLLGLVWTPCVGPTLGAAALLASQGESLVTVTVTMIAFAIGAATSLAMIGVAWRSLSSASKTRVRETASGGKSLFGVMFVLFGLLAATGLDRPLEALLLSVSPDWLIRLTTSI